MSRPVWARGLKLAFEHIPKRTSKSRPVWARGLKLVFTDLHIVLLGRAPCGRVD